MPHQYTQIPLAAKIVKLLVRDYEQAQKAPGVPGLGRDGARTPVSDDEVRGGIKRVLGNQRLMIVYAL